MTKHKNNRSQAYQSIQHSVRLHKAGTAWVAIVCFILMVGVGVGRAAARATTQNAPIPAGNEFRISPAGAGNQDHGAIEMKQDGSFLAAWHGQPATPLVSSYARLYDPSASPLSTAIRVNPTTDHTNENPAIALSDSGRAVVVWTTVDDAGQWHVMLRVHGAGVTTPTPIRVNLLEDASDPEPQPDVCMFHGDAYAGYFLVVWHDKDYAAATQTTMGRLFLPDGNPATAPFAISQAPSWPTGALQAFIDTLPIERRHKFGFPDAACNGAGDVMVAWERHGDQGAIVTRRFNPFVAQWQDEEVVAAPPASVVAQRRPKISLNDAGEAAVTWLNSVAGQPESPLTTSGQLRQVSGAGVWGAVVAVGDGMGIMFPDLKVATNGSLFVTWTDYTSEGEADIYLQGIGQDGQPLTEPVLISVMPDSSVPRPGEQVRSAVDWNTDGNTLKMTIVWESAHVDGYFNIFGRQFTYTPGG